jgi:hypothetical protein
VAGSDDPGISRCSRRPSDLDPDLSYLESIGWKADAGFYTIGWSGLDQVQRMQG